MKSKGTDRLSRPGLGGGGGGWRVWYNLLRGLILWGDTPYSQMADRREKTGAWS